MPRTLHLFLLALTMGATLTATATPPLAPVIELANESVVLPLQDWEEADSNGNEPFQQLKEEEHAAPDKDLQAEEYIVPAQPGAAATLLKGSLDPIEPVPDGSQ
jgi:hypothetical protein